jgi:hypothetical protein
MVCVKPRSWAIAKYGTIMEISVEIIFRKNLFIVIISGKGV